jgi:hypothetical protein
MEVLLSGQQILISLRKTTLLFPLVVDVIELTKMISFVNQAIHKYRMGIDINVLLQEDFSRTISSVPIPNRGMQA